MNREQNIIGGEIEMKQDNGCQCNECQIVKHASDCAVHNEPALPKGICTCGATISSEKTVEVER
jgi:hypothetical protein